MQTYSTGKTNTLLVMSSIAVWILNAIFYAIVLCLTYYMALQPSFKDLSLYEAGTVAFVGLCMSLQAKVAFFHHQWAYPQATVMFISVLGMFVYFLLIAISTDTYYYVANMTYELDVFWLFGFFTGPLMAVLIDVIGYYGKWFFFPTLEMKYHEMEHAVSHFLRFQCVIILITCNIGFV